MSTNMPKLWVWVRFGTILGSIWMPKCSKNDSKIELVFRDDFSIVETSVETSKKEIILSRKSHSVKKNTKHVKMCRFARRPSEKHDFEGPRPLK